MPVRVVIVEDEGLLREGLSELMSLADGLELVGTASDYPSAVDLIERECPDVVVTDIRVPPTKTDEGIQLAKQLRQSRPEIAVIILSSYLEPAYAVALLDDGVAGRGYLLKAHVGRFAELTDAVRQVAAGGSVFDPMVVQNLVQTRRARSSVLDQLSPRELQVLDQIAQGKSNAAAGGALSLTEKAVERHANTIFAKLGLSHEKEINKRVRAVLLYLDQR